MELLRFYCDDLNYSHAELSSEEAHHLTRVHRISVGDKVELFDGQGGVALAVIQDTHAKKKVRLKIEEFKVQPRPWDARIIIAASIAKGDRFDWLIGKCTELGVDRLVPIICERTVKQPKNPKIKERWKNITISSAKQCRRLYLPQIDSPISLYEAVEALESEYPNPRFLLGSFEDQAQSLIGLNFNNSDAIAFIGPEGGFTELELALLTDHKAVHVSLTDTILRTETAALAFAAILTSQRNAGKNM
ncbi:MAG: RsmE family RNA methyltransferase [Planctomycetota bacterium]|jgi:16S rRNA (uracil1498-N3)-methyltransferase